MCQPITTAAKNGEAFFLLFLLMESRKAETFFSVPMVCVRVVPLQSDKTWQDYDYCVLWSLMPCNPRLNACQKSAFHVSNYDIAYTNSHI